MTTKTIGSASRDYSSATAWLAAWPGNVGATWQGECYNDSVFTQSIETYPITFNQANNSSNPIVLTAAAGQSFADAASPIGGWDSSKGVAFSNTGTYGAARCITVSTDYVTISRLQLKSTAANVNSCTLDVSDAGSASPHGLLDTLIVESTNSANDGVLSVRGCAQTKNCLAVARNVSGGTAVGIFCGHGATGVNPKVDNCTVVCPTTYTAGAAAFRGSYNTSVITNCTGFGFTAFFNSTARFTGSDYNATDAATVGVGTHNVTSVAFSTSTFVVVVDTNHNFRLVSGSALLDVGFTDSTNVNPSVDAFGTARPQGSAWDIGFHELVSGGGGVSVAITGNSVTASEGNLGKSVVHALTGNASTASEGTLGTNVNRRVALTGNQSTASEGSVSSKISHALTGNSVTASEGTLTPRAGFNVALTGNQVTTSEGNLGKSVVHALTGNQAATSEGALTPSTSGPVTIALTGNQMTASQGALSPSGGIIIDTHDGGPKRHKRHEEQKKKEEKDFRERQERRRQQMIAAFEQVIEGNVSRETSIEQVIEPAATYAVQIPEIAQKSDFDFNKWLQNLDNAQRILDDYLEADDEEVLVFL